MMSRIITDSKMKLRDKLSFFIFIAVVIVSVCINCLVTVANPDTLVNAFCDKEVVESLRLDVSVYAKDMSLKNNITDDFVEDSITYDAMYLLERAYISGRLGASEEFNKDAFESYLDEFKAQLAEEVGKMIDEKNIQTDPAVSDTAVDDFCGDIADYIDSRINLTYMSNVFTGIKMLHIAAVVLLAVFGLSAAGAIAFMALKGGKTYRVLRHISYSVLGASFVGFINAGIIGIVKAAKDLVIYPLYYAKAFMNYVDLSVQSVIMSSLFLLIVFFILITAVWRIKRDENE